MLIMNKMMTRMNRLAILTTFFLGNTQDKPGKSVEGLIPNIKAPTQLVHGPRNIILWSITKTVLRTRALERLKEFTN